MALISPNGVTIFCGYIVGSGLRASALNCCSFPYDVWGFLTLMFWPS